MTRRLRDSLPTLLILAALGVTPMIALALGDPFIVKVATRVVVFAIAAVALNFVVGYGGLVSLCHAGFFGIGGYVVGILAWHDFNSEALWFLPGTSDLALSLPAAILVSAAIAAIVGAISLRTSGPYFLMITLAFNQMFYYGAIALQKYGGDDGLQVMSTITLGPLEVSNRYRFFYLALAILALTLLLIGRFVDSRFGMVLRAASKNETRVVAVGVDPWLTRLVAFVISAVLTAVAGALLAAGQQFISPVDMGWDRSGDLVVMAVLGGVGAVWGPALGAAAFVVLELVLSSWTTHWQLAFGLFIVLIVVSLRGGLADLGRTILSRKQGEAKHG
ncbi:MAG: branched-chain amino acid ABC transporter permease [Hyphomicrobiales bacterium]|nr:branched-chain amino acid ABC transporter permease [Hyphomicrobiales bacterium]MCC2108513.1 branched-chain amino acid ABC transporter permease [Hyphomicrobiales bacterium]